MANKNIRQDKQLATYLRRRHQRLTERQSKLIKELEARFSVEKYQELNIVNNSILCCENRMNGKYKDVRGEFEVSIGRNIYSED